jgi:hypothetical protein
MPISSSLNHLSGCERCFKDLGMDDVHESIHEVVSYEEFLFFRGRGRIVGDELYCCMDLFTLHPLRASYDEGTDINKMFLDNDGNILALDSFSKEPEITIGALRDDRVGYNAVFYNDVVLAESTHCSYDIRMRIREYSAVAVVRRWRRLRRVARRVGRIALFVRELYSHILAPDGPAFQRAMTRLRKHYAM